MLRIYITPIIITILQISGIGRVWYIYLYEDGQIPQSFIELNILTVFNIGVLILFRFRYFNSGKKIGLWLLPISISLLIIFILVISYLFMVFEKYR